MSFKKILTDERDTQVSGQSAFIALKIYSLTAFIMAAVLFVSHGFNPAFEPMAITLVYSICFLTLTYALIFKFHDMLLLAKNKTVYYVVFSFIIVILAIFTLRLFSGEDDWICQNGQWVTHGHPDFSAPTAVCK